MFYLRCLLLFCLFLPRSLTLVCDFPFYCLFIDPITILKLSFILEKENSFVCSFLHASILLISSSLLEKNNMSSDQSTSNHLNQNTKPGLQNLTSHLLPDIKHPPHSSFIKDQTKTIRTVPNSPYIDSCSTPPPPSSSNTLLSGSRPLTKVKSLGKIDIRSPIPINSVLQTPRIPALDQLQDETYSKDNPNQ